MSDLTNSQIAAAFDELGDLYELDGVVQYRVIAYRNAAKAVRDAAVSVAELTRQGRATELAG
ncbi:MAG: histidinol-phosphatase, partial [Rubrobacter sp.]|nr:histidinol-phosphatase [Rubrobacter sp.]